SFQKMNPQPLIPWSGIFSCVIFAAWRNSVRNRFPSGSCLPQHGTNKTIPPTVLGNIRLSKNQPT
ncbi:MAG: hypothetical protein PHE53_12030, partial [Thermoguttaceae bacterium]|nr:hypothetical protein [Thermoguttaceae bacterium]